MATKLRNMRLTSVDLVRAGANQEADICLYKSAYPAETTDQADHQPNLEEIYKNAITESLQSIVADNTLSIDEKNTMIEKSIGQYHDKMVEFAGTQTTPHPNTMSYGQTRERNENTMIRIDKSLFTMEELQAYNALIAKASVDPEAAQDEMEEENDFPMIPKKRPPFAQKADDFEEDYYDDEEDDEDMMIPANPKKKCNPTTQKACGVSDSGMEKAKCQKSASPVIKSAMDRLEKLEKSIEMQKFTEIAKKYAVLGENEDVLANTLYDMQKSSPENYDAYIAVLDKSLDLVQKSGLFAEFGKSAGAFGGYTGGAVNKIETAANIIMQANPTMSRDQAVAKAWTDHPELIAEYEREYKG